MSAFVRRQYGVLKSFLLGIFLALMALTSVSFGLTELNDGAMEDVSGTGLAFAFDDFRFQMEPTSFFENMGTVPTNKTRPATGNIWPANPTYTNAYKGDYRWIGTTISRGYQLTGTNTIDYANLFGYADYISSGSFISSPTTHGGKSVAAAQSAALEYKPYGWQTGDPLQTLSYPIATGGAQGYAEINNPFVIRVHSYNAVGLSCTLGTTGCTNPRWATNKPMTVLELVGATHSSPFRWAFWGEVDTMKDTVGTVLSTVPRDSTYYNSYLLGRLTNQEIIIGSPTSRFKPDGSRPAGDGTGIEIGCTGTGTGITGCGNDAYKIMGPVFRMYQSMGSTNTGTGGAAVGGGNNDQTLGMIYLHRLSGDYRFSVNQVNVDGVAAVTGQSAVYGRTAGGKVIPYFDTQEGMYFMDVNAYLPMGQLHYQSLIVSGVTSGTSYTGDFITETSLLPNDPFAYNDFYGYPTNLANTAPPTAATLGFNRSGLKDRYYETHGYVRWGDNFPTASEIVTELGDTSPGLDASHKASATRITNNLLGSGITNTKGWSGTGITSGATVTVNYHIPTYAVNDTNFPRAQGSGILGIGAVSFGLCEGSRDKYCNSYTGSTSDVARSMIVNVNTTIPVGSGTKAELLSAGGMVFLARDTGSWSLPLNSNLASAGAVSESINLLAFGNWDVKKALTSTVSYSCGTTTCWRLQGNASYNGTTVDNAVKGVITANGGVSPTLTINGISLGSSRVEGMAIQHLKVTTLGAAN